MDLKITVAQDDAGKWLAVVDGQPGLMSYGNTAGWAIREIQIMLFKALAQQLESGELRAQETLTLKVELEGVGNAV